MNPSIAKEIWIPNKRIVKRVEEEEEISHNSNMQQQEKKTRRKKRKKKKKKTTLLLAIQNASLADLWQVFNQFQDVIVSTGTYSQ